MSREFMDIINLFIQLKATIHSIQALQQGFTILFSVEPFTLK